MALPGWYTSWEGGNLDGSNGYTDSWQSGTPTVTSGQSQYATGRSLRISLPASGAGTPGGSASASDGTFQRCENYTDLTAVTGTGSFAWTSGFSAYFGLLVTLTTFPISYSSWQLISQWKNSSTGSPPLQLSVNNGAMYLDGNNGGWSQMIGVPTEGVPYKVILGLTLTTSASTSNINVWVNDTQFLTNAKPSGAGLMYSGQASYWKYGCYRSASPAPGTAVLDYGGAAVSTSSYSDVSDYLDSLLTPTGPPPVAPVTAEVMAMRNAAASVGACW